MGSEGVDVSWNVSPVSSPITVLSHHGELNKVIIIGLKTSPSRLFLFLSEEKAKLLRRYVGSIEQKNQLLR